MATYKDLQDRINLDYLNQMTLIPETQRAIASVIRCYEGRRFWFNETATTVALTSSQSFLTVPSDFLSLDRLEVTESGASVRLTETTFNSIRDMNVTTNFGVPTFYAYHGNRFELSSIPNSAYAANIYYIHSLPPLSADTDTNPWTTEAFNLIAHAAAVELMSNVMQVTDTKRITNHQLAVQMALNELGTRNETRLASRLSHTYF